MLPSLVLYPGNRTSAWFQKEDMSLGKSFRGANQSSKHSRNGMSQREVHRSHITGCRVLTPLLWKQIASCPLAPKQACKCLHFEALLSVTKSALRTFQQHNRYNSSYDRCIHANMFFLLFRPVYHFSYFVQGVIHQYPV